MSVYLNNTVETIHAVEKVLIPGQTHPRRRGIRDLFHDAPSDGHFINLYTRRDLVFLVPIMLAAIVLILYFTLRSRKALLPPVLVVVLANIWLFGLIGWSGRPMTIITPAAPVLLLALGSAYGLYVVNKIRSDVETGRNIDVKQRRERVIVSTAAVVTPILYAAVTDIIGFLSFRGVKLSLVADFGLFAAIGLFFAAGLAVTLLPALAATIDFGDVRPSNSRFRLSGFLESAAGRIIRRPRLALAAFGILIAFGIAGIFRVEAEVASPSSTKKSVPYRAMDAANEHFKGAYPDSFFFGPTAYPRPAKLRLIRRAESYLSGLKSTSPSGSPDRRGLSRRTTVPPCRKRRLAVEEPLAFPGRPEGADPG